MDFALVALIAFMAYREWCAERERRDHATQAGELLQRIQAPELAVVAHASEEPREPVNGMPLFSDEDYAEMTNGN